jgi:glucose-6-phosphate isomerase, archaeal
VEDVIKRIEKKGGKSETRLSDLRDFLSGKDKEKADEILLKKNPAIYSVRFLDEGKISYAITYMNAGKVGKQDYMTKGHYHLNGSPEVYYLISGRGKLVLRKGKDRKVVAMKKGVFHYIPSGYGHRTVNAGTGRLVFLSIYEKDAGHDYEKVKREGL